jgi:hypothetical protein
MQQVFVLLVMFDNGVSIQEYRASNMSVNDELERKWQEAVVACFEVLSQALPGD